ncbi:hypothetical protein ABC795_04645 [Blastococcus sp. HT6-30]|uniref:hypothetical protein n=1 Tax=Blastococcus sp. HT6-30 TaxID=3144843 RepID=UPI00321A8B4D
MIDTIAAMHARGVVEVNTSDLLAELAAQGRSARRESLRPLLSELSGAARGGRRVAGAELIRLRMDCYRITGEFGPLASPRPASERGMTLHRALRSWMEERAAAGAREFGLADATAGIRKYGMSTSRATVKGVLASHFMFTGARADVGRRAMGDSVPTVKRAGHGRYRFVGHARLDGVNTQRAVTPLGRRIVSVLARCQAAGQTEITGRDLGERLDPPATPQAIVRQLHRLHHSGVVNVQFLGNNRRRSYVFEVLQGNGRVDSEKCTRKGESIRMSGKSAPARSAA